MYRLIGGTLIISGCLFIGKSKALAEKRAIFLLEEFVKGLNLMICELEFRRTSLPALCAFISNQTTSIISKYFSILEQELAKQITPNVKDSTETALRKCEDLPPAIKELFCVFGESLGLYHVDGQVKQLKYVKELAENKLLHIMKQHEQFGRASQTLWVCIGVAATIIMF